MCGGNSADCLIVPGKAERTAKERSRIRVREGCERYHSCKCGRTAGQGSLDDNQDGVKDFRFYGSPN